MNDNISRQAVMNLIKTQWIYNLSDIEDERECLQEIADLPSARLERKKGKWIYPYETTTLVSICSECGAHGKGNYCPNCGADMRGEDDEGHNL